MPRQSPEEIARTLDEFSGHYVLRLAKSDGVPTYSAGGLYDGVDGTSFRGAFLKDCRNVKVKRLFLFFADRHPHAWLKRLDKQAIDLGNGKRMLVKGGKLNKAYQITVPEELDAVQ